MKVVGKTGKKNHKKNNYKYFIKTKYNFGLINIKLKKNKMNLIEYVQNKYNIIGKSQLIKDAVEKLIQAAPTDLTVLITGETGTGKEVFSNALHGMSERQKNSFVSVNCGAIPETLLESELFGSEKGAFTGSVEQRKGFFEVAHKGTIFLDEIGDMPLSTQVKLLRVLESGEFSRLGSSTIHKIDVRIIAATNKDLQDEVRLGNFRQDLYFRLNSVTIYLPALRNHPEDIPLLFFYFASKKYEKLKINFDGITDDAIELLKLQPWEGNIRELKNFVDTMITLEKKSFLTADIIRKYTKPTLPPFSYNSNDNFSNNDLHTNNNSLSLTKINAKDDFYRNEMGLIFRTLLEIQNDLLEVKSSVKELGNNFDDFKIHINTEDISSKSENDSLQIDELLTKSKINEIEKLMIEKCLIKYKHNKRAISKVLGISERTLYRKIDELGIN